MSTVALSHRTCRFSSGTEIHVCLATGPTVSILPNFDGVVDQVEPVEKIENFPDCGSEGQPTHLDSRAVAEAATKVAFPLKSTRGRTVARGFGSIGVLGVGMGRRWVVAWRGVLRWRVVGSSRRVVRSRGIVTSRSVTVAKAY